MVRARCGVDEIKVVKRPRAVRRRVEAETVDDVSYGRGWRVELLTSVAVDGVRWVVTARATLREA
eukprot:7988055-Pyramimonas_sp.AAC.1